MSAASLPLALVAESQSVEVISIAGGREMQRRLCDLGILVGRELTVLQRAGCGPVVVGIGDARLALGQDVTRRIFVRPK